MILTTTTTAVLPCELDCFNRNAARFITVDDRLACGVCAVKHKIDAVKIASVPELLQLVREYLYIEDPADATMMSAQGGVPSPRDRPQMWAKRFREIVGKDVSKP